MIQLHINPRPPMDRDRQYYDGTPPRPTRHRVPGEWDETDGMDCLAEAEAWLDWRHRVRTRMRIREQRTDFAAHRDTYAAALGIPTLRAVVKPKPKPKPKPYACPDCGRGYNNRNALHRHRMGFSAGQVPCPFAPPREQVQWVDGRGWQVAR